VKQLFCLYFTEKNKFIKNASVTEEKRGETIALDNGTALKDEGRKTGEEAGMKDEPT
jgi:hypothetical protein